MRARAINLHKLFSAILLLLPMFLCAAHRIRISVHVHVRSGGVRKPRVGGDVDAMCPLLESMARVMVLLCGG